MADMADDLALNLVPWVHLGRQIGCAFQIFKCDASMHTQTLYAGHNLTISQEIILRPVVKQINIYALIVWRLKRDTKMKIWEPRY